MRSPSGGFTLPSSPERVAEMRCPSGGFTLSQPPEMRCPSDGFTLTEGPDKAATAPALTEMRCPSDGFTLEGSPTRTAAMRCPSGGFTPSQPPEMRCPSGGFTPSGGPLESTPQTEASDVHHDSGTSFLEPHGSSLTTDRDADSNQLDTQPVDSCLEKEDEVVYSGDSPSVVVPSETIPHQEPTINSPKEPHERDLSIEIQDGNPARVITSTPMPHRDPIPTSLQGQDPAESQQPVPAETSSRRSQRYRRAPSRFTP